MTSESVDLADEGQTIKAVNLTDKITLTTIPMQIIEHNLTITHSKAQCFLREIIFRESSLAW